MSQSAALEFRLFARVGWSALAVVCCSKSATLQGVSPIQ